MTNYQLALEAGVTKKAIQKIVTNGLEEKEIFRFIHGDVNQIHQRLPKRSGLQRWDSTGKRFVHIEEAKFVARHFLRNAIRPGSNKALVLSGADPALACLPWAMSGLATDFVAYELNPVTYALAKKNLSSERRKIRSRISNKRKLSLNLVLGNILNEDRHRYGIIDLDFCSNRIRTSESRDEILNLVDTVSPTAGPFVLRTTLHLGRVNNSKEDVERHVDAFEEKLRDSKLGYQQYRIRAHDISPYQSSLPMVSLVWILERREDQTELIGEIE